MLIYGLGSNGSGQLGIGHHDDVSSPTLLVLPDALKDQEIINIASGGNHTLFHCKSGTIYATGWNQDGRCGRDASDIVFTTLQPSKLLNSSSHILFCAATWSASVIVTGHGSLLSCGSGTAGELGLGVGRELASVPEKIIDLTDYHSQVTQLDTGMAHAVIVLSDGNVLAWGNGRNGQIGDPSEVVWSPRLIAVPFPVVRAACGKDFTCLMSASEFGEVLLLGPSKRDRFHIRASIPNSIPFWKQVIASWGTIFVRDENDKIQGFGRNDRGQLGPAEIPPVKQLSAGSEHVLAKTEDGRVVVWGWGEHGNCGSPVDDQKDVKGRYNVLDIPGHVLSLGTGCATSFIIADDGCDTASAVHHGSIEEAMEL